MHKGLCAACRLYRSAATLQSNPNKITFVAHNANGVLLAVRPNTLDTSATLKLTFVDDKQAKAFFNAFVSGKQPACVAETVDIDLYDCLTQRHELSWLSK